jgi:hypothetical protein
MKQRWSLTVAACMVMARTLAGQTMMMHHHEAGASTATLRSFMDKGDLVFEVGPIRLPANAMHDEIVQPPPLTVLAGADGWAHGYSIEVVDSAGHPVPQKVVHHVNVIAPQKRELFSQIMLRLAAAGTETAPVGLPWFLGYPISNTDSVLVTAMMHNPTATDYGAVYLRVRMPLKKKGVLGAMAIYPFYLDVMPPAGSHSFDLPAGRSATYWEGKPAVPGRILGLSGHLHKYGTSLTLEDRTTGKVIWEGRPKVDSAGEVQAMPVKKFLATFGVGLDTSHTYRLTAVYDNPTGAPVIDGGMGALGGVFKPADKAWPAVMPSDPEYVLDWRLQHRLENRDRKGPHGNQP